MCRSDLLKLPILCYMHVFKGSQTTDCNFHLWVTAAWKHISDWMAGNESRINALAQRVPRSEEEENNVVDVLSACDEYFKCSINTNTMIHKEFWLNVSCGWCPPTLSLLFFYFYLLIHFFYLFILSVFNRTKLLSWRNPHPFFPSLPPSLCLSTRELKHRATQQPNEPKFQIHDYIESQKQKSGCCSTV